MKIFDYCLYPNFVYCLHACGLNLRLGSVKVSWPIWNSNSAGDYNPGQQFEHLTLVALVIIQCTSYIEGEAVHSFQVGSPTLYIDGGVESLSMSETRVFAEVQ